MPDPATCCREQLSGFQQDGQHDLLAVYREQLFGFLELEDPILTRTIWQRVTPITSPIPIKARTISLKNKPDSTPIPMRIGIVRVILRVPPASKYASFWVLRYFVLSSLGLYGWLWLFSCVSVLCLEIPVVLPVFPLLSYCLCVHVAHELCLPVALSPSITVLQPE